MATQNLAPSALPLFPQIGYPHISTPDLDRCDYQCRDFPFEGESCQQLGVVHHLESEREFCLGHFNQLERGGSRG